ncbi:MAG: zinc-ribbon domain-containing protein [Lachnospiraceae bacterium]|nr:zinc-ribbon domain-containing protein [Lachnospiraceae bacterium]
MSKFCENCGAPLTPGAKFCESCGSRIESTESDVSNYADVNEGGYSDQYQDPNEGAYSNAPYEDQTQYTDGYADTGSSSGNPEQKTGQSVMGIVALILSCSCCFSVIGLILGIIDLTANKNDGKKHDLALAAIVVGAVLTLIGLVGSITGA